MAVSYPAPEAVPVGAQEAAPDLQEIRRKGIKRFLVTLPAYCCAVAIVVIGAALGVVRPSSAWLICVVTSITQLGFYLALRSGVAARSKDPLLAFPQVMFGIALVALGYAVLDGLRSTALLWLSVIMVFDMRRLPRRQMLMAAGSFVILLLLATAARARWHPDGLPGVHEVFTIGLLAVTLPALLAVSARARSMRKRQEQQKELMAAALEQLRQLSVRDGLTGLFNRRHMLDLLEEELKRWQRAGHPFCVAIIDIDFFKRVNDRHGHAAGDTVLQVFAQLGRETFPDQVDALARWGGEEFLLLLPQRDADECAAALGRLSAAVQSCNWAVVAEGLAVTFSAGVCQHREGRSLEQTLEGADRALYRAKETGRNRVLLADAADAGETAKADAVVPRIAGGAALPRSPRAEPARPAVSAAAAAGPAATRQTRSPVSLPGALHVLADWVMGTDPRVRPYQPMGLLAIVVYMACLAGFLLYVGPAGVLTQQQTMLFAAHCLLGAFLPYTLIRVGVTAHLRDPACTVYQLMWAGSGLIVAYALMPVTSTNVLQMICLCVVYGFLDLRPGETRFLGWSFIAMMLGELALKAWLQPAQFNPRHETLEVAMTCLVLWLLTLQSHHLSRNRERVRAEKRELAATTERVNQLMMHDPLTGLFNRQHMQQVLERECDRQRRADVGFCVALIDLDHFKSINDRHGHRVGDEALVGFAQAASAVLRETDVICRWGGEEFLVLLADTEPGPNAALALERLREQLAALRVCADAPELRLTFSAGMAEHHRGEDIAATLERADKALYEAKAAGRNRCVLAVPAH